MSFTTLPASITAPQGFRAAGVVCGIKRLGTGKGSNKGPKRDLALLVSDLPAAVAGMFTTNQVAAAPVKLSIPRARQAFARAVVMNSGNANACTGAAGMRDAREMTKLVADQLDLTERSVLVCSTGRIGVPMPMPRIKRGILAAAAHLAASPENGHQVAEAIMTSDTRPKEIAVELVLAKQRVRIAGVAKGAGMIQPGMSLSGVRPAARPLHATMLAVLTSDAAVESRALKSSLAEAVANSFNRITVDGDMSTNDTVILLANGMARNPVLTLNPSSRPLLRKFQEALNHVALELAKMIVRDGEGISRFVTVRVSGARNFTDADAAARAVANSALVKTSWCGGDPNWGRILDALGYSQARVNEEKVDIAYSPPGSSQRIYAVQGGRPARTPFRRLCAAVAAPEFDLHIGLNLGKAKAVVYTCDLTEAYVDFNKGDIGNPSALGG
ncbi:MAG TPA: bifunctional glutamate N-acetyltransferase/amino-acid acetyltransferase ArgJ [Candidatus Paceibacterota bacterium]|nr:bifunctional glutamate N-acetyltransferase/amino-acid acetyltransferase ArgJ [Verrucomicrobiota bacterium]HRY48911.1 bifunctional glutamate N-acetyltransferase/amino-acid acetyltransferase ArgJ [Candidatus Paceibacterota bacterium]HRZ99123.1 bifunctional glutamate N-acetyltransferase/amino-acid acetyltransferase ArgJ [Candidatus Paceibacterota bacterium]